MDGKLMIALFAALLMAGFVMGQGGDPAQEDLSGLSKDKQLMIVNELIKAHEQIFKALKKMIKNVGGPGGPPGGSSGEENSHEHIDDGSSESEEEQAYYHMKQKKIKEARDQIEGNVHNLASNFISMNQNVEDINKAVDKAIWENKEHHVDYNVYYSKPKPHHHHHHHQSSEESDEQGYKKVQRPARRHYRGGRQLGDEQETIVEEDDVIKTVDGEEVLQTLPETGAATVGQTE